MTRENAWKPVNTGEQDSKIDQDLVQNLVKFIYGDEYEFLAESALERLESTNKFYNYYNLDGQYWTPPSSMGYLPTIMPINLARWFVRKRAGWLFEVAPDIECPPKQVDSQEMMVTQGYEPTKKQLAADKRAADKEQFLYSEWGENKFDEKLLEAGNDYYIGGTVALKIRYLDGRGTRLNFSPAQEVFPVPNKDEPDVFDAIYFASYYHNDSQVWLQKWEMVDGKCKVTEGIYNRELELEDYLIKPGTDTGLDFIPVLLFPRARLSGQTFGTSYLKDMIPLFDQYNRTMSDAADSLRFNLFAITVLVNGVPDAEKELVINPGAIWNVGGDGVDVKKLESSFQYSQALGDFLTRLENQMHLIGGVPDITPDRIKGFGLVSGVAIKLLYSDLVSETQQDQRVWKSRLVTANEYMLRIAERHGTFNPRGDYTNRIIPHLPLPENEAEKIQMETQKLGASLQSLMGALQELGEKNPARKIAEIITEKERFESITVSGSNNNEPESPSIRRQREPETGGQTTG